MPETTKNIYYCKKCGKPMEYKEKSMLYIYDVIYRRHKYSTDYIPQKKDTQLIFAKIVAKWQRKWLSYGRKERVYETNKNNNKNI